MRLGKTIVVIMVLGLISCKNTEVQSSVKGPAEPAPAGSSSDVNVFAEIVKLTEDAVTLDGCSVQRKKGTDENVISFEINGNAAMTMTSDAKRYLIRGKTKDYYAIYEKHEGNSQESLRLFPKMERRHNVAIYSTGKEGNDPNLELLYIRIEEFRRGIFGDYGTKDRWKRRCGKLTGYIPNPQHHILII